MKVKCPDCNHRFDIEENDYFEGDCLNCPDCNLDLVVEVDLLGKIKIKTVKEKELEEGDFEDFFDE